MSLISTTVITGVHPPGCSKRPDISPAQPRRVISSARPESAKTDSSPWDAPYPKQGPSNSLHSPLGEWPRLPSTTRMGRGPSDSPTSPEGVGRLFFTARIERPPLYRGGSASKKNGLPAPSHSSEARALREHGDRSSYPAPFQHPATHPVADNAASGQTQPSHPAPPDAGPAQDRGRRHGLAM
jgi:hypothetical protein